MNASRSALFAALLAPVVLGQVAIPPHATSYTGYSRGFNFTANTNFIINQLGLPPEVYQAGDTAGYMVRVNGVEVLRSVGNAGAINTSIVINPGDVVDVIGNWSPVVTGNFTAHNSYGTGPFNTMIEGVAHTLTRTGWQWDIGDPAYASGTYLAPTTGQLGRILMYTNPPAGLYPSFTATPTSGASPLSVQFTDTTFTSDPNGVQVWAWDFDNNGSIDSNAQHPSHIYTQGGLYSVTLYVSDATHGLAQTTAVDLIDVDPISVGFSYTPGAGSAPLIVQFTDTTVGNPTSWAWDFDNNGTVDSNLQNPAYLYTVPGRYSVSLTANNGSNTGTFTVTDAVRVLGPTNNTAGAELLEYQFNEASGTRVANAASTTAAPSHGTVTQYNTATPVTGWQVAAGRGSWDANDPGTGAFRANNVSPYQRVNTGWQIDIVGSNSIAFWFRPTTTIGTSYLFGTSSGDSGRAYYTSSLPGISLRNWGNLPFVDSATNPNTLTGWNHLCCVIDDGAGSAQWYLNGVADGVAVAFPAGTFTYQSAGNLVIGNYTTTSSAFSRYADMDDFRLYARALTPAEIAGVVAQENPSATTFGVACAGPGGNPVLGSTGGAPAVGNGSFAVTTSNMQAGAPQAIHIGLFTSSFGLPFDLGAILPATHSGCFAQVYPDLLSLGIGSGTSAVVPLGIPVNPGIAGTHVYCQVIALGSTGAVSDLLDVSIQN